MNRTLKEKAINGAIWNAIGNFSQQGIQFVISIILARLLLPEQFGLIGMLAIFFAIARAFLDSGFGQALIQKKNPSPEDYSTVFIFNISISLVLYCVLYVTAPFIADFYKQSELTNLARFVGINILINSFSLVQNAIIIKRIDFKTQTKISLVSVSLSGGLGIALAYNGFGVWSLAIQQVSMTLSRAFLLWFFSKWHPTLVFNFESFKNLFSYGSKLLLSGLLNVIFDNIYTITIGKAFSALDLGFYSRAVRLQDLPTKNINGIFQNVTFPTFVKIQDDNRRLKIGYQKTLKSMVFVNFPIMLGMLVMARPLVITLLTEKWLPAVPYLQLLTLVGITYPINSLNLNILKVKGRSDLFLKLEIIKKVFIALAIVISINFGMLAIVVGQVITAYICLFINSYYMNKFLDYHLKEQILDILPTFSLATLMSTALYFFSFLNLDHMQLLITQIALGVLIYSVLAKIFSLDAYQEFRTIALNKFPGLKLI